MSPEHRTVRQLIVKSRGRLLLLKAEEIDWIEAAGNYLYLHIGTDAHLLRGTLQGMEEKLDPQVFLRIHRSRIVNLDRVREMQPLLSGDYTVILRNGTRLTLSRGYRERVRERLGATL
jgi:two-component system, LytTR family, response regulator